MAKFFLLMVVFSFGCRDDKDEKSSSGCDKKSLTECQLEMDDIDQKCVAGCKGVGSDLILVCQTKCDQVKIEGYDSCLELYCSTSSGENEDNSNDSSGSFVDTGEDEPKNPVCRRNCTEKRSDCYDDCLEPVERSCLDKCNDWEQDCFDDCDDLAVDVSTDDGLDHSVTCEFDCDFTYTKCTNRCENKVCFDNCGIMRDSCKAKCA